LKYRKEKGERETEQTSGERLDQASWLHLKSLKTSFPILGLFWALLLSL